MRVAIVGAGAIGLSVAAALAREGAAEIVVLEAGDRPFSRASGNGLGWVNASNKWPKAYFELNARGVERHRMLSNSSDQGWFTESGTFTAYSYRPGAALLYHNLAECGYPARPTKLYQVFDETGFNHPVIPDESGSFYPGEGWIDTVRYVDYCLDQLRNRAGEILYNSAVTSVKVGLESITVESQGGNRKVDSLVNAGGVSAPFIAKFVGRILPLNCRVGLVLEVETNTPIISTVVMHELLDVRPVSATRYLLHSDHVDALLLEYGHHGTQRESAMRELCARATRFHRGFEGLRVKSIRVGNRPIPIDGLPVLGQIEGIPGYIEAVSHSGITLGPVIGDLIAELLYQGDSCANIPEPFMAARF